MTAPAPPHAASVSPDVLAALRCFRVIVRSVQRQFQAVQGAAGVSGSQLWCLALLREQPGLSVTALAQAMGIRQASASQLVDALDRKGYVRRQRSSQDQRMLRLTLSPAGRKLLAQAPAPAAGLLPDALAGLSSTELAQLTGLLGRLLGQMRLRDDDARDIPLADL